MKNLFYTLLCLLITSCSNYLADEESENPIGNDQSIPLTVKVRSSSSGSKIETPLYVFIFNKEGKLVSQNNLKTNSTTFKAQLSAGDYTLSAIAGLREDFYSIPEKIENTSTITLPHGKTCPTPIQYGHCSFHLAKETELSIHLSYLVTSLEFKFSKVPADASQVNVILSPTSSGFTLNGNYTNDASSTTVSCKHNGDYWESQPIYILPSKNSKTTLTLSIDRPSGSETLAYTYSSQLQAAQPYRFSGKYNEKISLNGVFEVDGWKPGIDINFDFAEDGQQEGSQNEEHSYDEETNDGEGTNDGGDSQNSNVPILYCDNLPKAGEFWNNFYVWRSEIVSTDEASAILLSKKQWFSILAADGRDWLNDYSDSNLGNWRVFTKDEARAFYADYTTFADELNAQLQQHEQDPFYSNNKERYLCENCQYTFNLVGKLSVRAAGQKTEYYMRAIKDVRFKLRQ